MCVCVFVVQAAAESVESAPPPLLASLEAAAEDLLSRLQRKRRRLDGDGEDERQASLAPYTMTVPDIAWDYTISQYLLASGRRTRGCGTGKFDVGVLDVVSTVCYDSTGHSIALCDIAVPDKT